MNVKNLNDLLVDFVKDLYSAETQLEKALPKMANKVNNEELKKSFKHHLDQTKQQKERLETIAKKMGISPKGKSCAAMEGLVHEAEEMFEEIKDPDTLDAGLIGAAQKVEHYEIASYGTAKTFAKILGENEVANLLNETLEEEKETDMKLTQIAEKVVNVKATA
ncbi:ferritin-like domain-containing protein [Cytophagaceae bacterium ABcell3]|nr:ferritin-like domain-containing protein [Cytophagaceae bacterium ABcell3]